MSATGPLGELNGTDVLVYVPDGFGTYIPVLSQRNVNFKEATATIDWSSKASRAKRVTAGRYSATVTLAHGYIPSASGYIALRNAMRNGTAVNCRRMQGGTPTTLETAAAIVVGLGEDFPDQGPGVVSVDLEIDGTWA